MSVCVVPFQVEIGRIGNGAATWAVTNWGNMACSCRCSCCHRGQSCIAGLITLVSILRVSVEDSIKLGEGSLAVGSLETSCGGTGCLSCRGKQSTSLLLLLSSSGRLLFSNPRYADCFVSVLFVVRLRGACVGLCV